MSQQPAPEITEDLIAAHGLAPDEYQRILDLIGREPSFTELGIFSAMWNEHCSYKSSKKWLRTLPTEGPRVIHGPGKMPALWILVMAIVWSLKWKATTTPLISSPIRVQPRRWWHFAGRLYHGCTAHCSDECATLWCARPSENAPCRLWRCCRCWRLRQFSGCQP